MPSQDANTTIYATKSGRIQSTLLASGLALNTFTKIADAGAKGSLLTDILFRNYAGAAVTVDIIIVPSGGDQTQIKHAICQFQTAANAGNSNNTVPGSVANSQPMLFDIDLAGNRGIALESGDTVWIKNTAALAGNLVVSAKLRDY